MEKDSERSGGRRMKVVGGELQTVGERQWFRQKTTVVGFTVIFHLKLTAHHCRSPSKAHHCCASPEAHHCCSPSKAHHCRSPSEALNYILYSTWVGDEFQTENNSDGLQMENDSGRQ